MPETIDLSNIQRYVLSRMAQSVADDEDAQPHWSAILLAANDKDATTEISERTGAPAVLVNTVLEKWKEAEENLTKAEASGVLAVHGAINGIFEDYEDFDTECFCCCDAEEEDENSLSPYEIEMLAGKVYNLLRMELLIERERLGYAYYSRT
jgi:hypothetical protein